MAQQEVPHPHSPMPRLPSPLTTGDQGIAAAQSTKETIAMTVISQELSNIYFVLKSSASGNADTHKLL